MNRPPAENLTCSPACWRLQRNGYLYELWWLPHQGGYGLVLHRDGKSNEGESFDGREAALRRAEAWRCELRAR